LRAAATSNSHKEAPLQILETSKSATSPHTHTQQGAPQLHRRSYAAASIFFTLPFSRLVRSSKHLGRSVVHSGHYKFRKRRNPPLRPSPHIRQPHTGTVDHTSSFPFTAGPCVRTNYLVGPPVLLSCLRTSLVDCCLTPP
jgi:hypothetical protein